MLRPAAELVVNLFSPRGGAEQVTLALVALNTMAPDVADWRNRLDQVVSWTDEANALAERGPRRSISAVDVLEGCLGDWPAPPVVKRLDALYLERQQRVVSGLRKPGSGDSARRALGELLLAHGDEIQRAVVSMAGVYLRAGLIGEAARRTAVLAGQTGDDPDLRALLAAAAKPGAAATDYLALARRFLPRIEFLGGTATEAPDPVIALRVLDAGIARHPGDAELLVLSSHVSRLLSSYFLAIRRLEEAQMVLEHTPNAAELTGRVSAELIELYFLRLRLRLDPERDAPAYAEADALKQRFAETHQRFQSADMKVKPADIDFELARSYVNAGQIDRAEPLFLRAREEGEPTAEVTVELANLALKRGDPARAAQIIREGLDAIRGAQELGARHDRLGRRPRAARTPARRLHRRGRRPRRRRSRVAQRAHRLGAPDDRAPAPQEPGRIGRSGRRGWSPALSAGPPRRGAAEVRRGDRGRTAIATRRTSTSIAFLVQHGETDAALSVYHRGLSRPGRAVSEYVKVYTSLWVLDLSRRTGKIGEPEGRGLPAHAGAPPRRSAPAPRRRLVPPARPLRGRSA